MSEPPHSAYKVNSEEKKIKKSDDNLGITSTEINALESLKNEYTREDQLLITDGNSTRLNDTNVSSHVSDIPILSLKREEISSKRVPNVQFCVESGMEQNSQQRLSTHIERECRSPSFFMYPVDSNLVHQERFCSVPEDPNITSKSIKRPPVASAVPTTEVKDVSLHGANSQTSRNGLKPPVNKKPDLQTSSPSIPKVMNEILRPSPGSFAYQSPRSFGWVTEPNNSLSSSTLYDFRERREAANSYDSPALWRESELNLRNSVALAAPRRSNSFFHESSNEQKSSHSWYGSPDVSCNLNLENNQFISRSGIYTSTNMRHLNIPEIDCGILMNSELHYLFERVNETSEFLWNERITNVQSPTPLVTQMTCNNKTNNDDGNLGDHQSKPLISNNLESNAFDERLILWSSRWTQIPPFSKPTDMTPILERADRNLADTVPPLVPVLNSSFFESKEDVIIGSSLDSRTLGSLSWLSSATDSEALRHHFRRVGQKHFEEIADSLGSKNKESDSSKAHSL